jgi:hypothetical protein
MNSTAKIDLASVIKKTGPSTGPLLSEWIFDYSGILTTLITFWRDLFCKRIK